MRVYYHLSSYISHRLSGLEYIACLRLLGHTVVCAPEPPRTADIAVIHDDPLNYEALFARHPELGHMRTIAFCAWENECLANAYIRPLSLVTDIWTPSRFSQASLLPRFAHAKVLPHVVRRSAPKAADMAFAEEALRDAGPGTRFFSVVDSINPRKNIESLLAAFAVLRERTGKPVFLVLKQYRVTLDYGGLPGVVSVTGDLSPEQMAALHIACDAYVSAHHAEGWGLGLSEAMAYGKPVIATAYSGNMDFMDERNSFPVPYAMEPVSEAMCERIPLFTSDMRWAAIDRNALVETMKKVAEGRVPAELAVRAAMTARRFSRESIAGRMRLLLEE